MKNKKGGQKVESGTNLIWWKVGVLQTFSLLIHVQKFLGQ